MPAQGQRGAGVMTEQEFTGRLGQLEAENRELKQALRIVAAAALAAASGLEDSENEEPIAVAEGRA